MPKLTQKMLLCLGLYSLLTLEYKAVAHSAEKTEGVININQANIKELGLLPNIGAKKAQIIIDYRNQHPFKDKEELARLKIGKRKIFGRRIFSRIKTLVALSGPTTLRAHLGREIIKKITHSSALTRGATSLKANK